MKKYAKIILKILVSAALISFLFFKEGKESVFSQISSMDLRFAPIVILLLTLNYLVSSLRWKALLLDQKNKVSVAYLTSLYFIGSFFNNFMPTSIGGDVYKIYKLGKKLNDTSRGFSSTFMERFTGVAVLLFISVFGLFAYIGSYTYLVLILFVIGAMVGFRLLGFFGKKFPVLSKYVDSIYSYKNDKKVIFWAIATSILVQVFSIFTQYFIFMSLGVTISLQSAFLFFPLITLASFFIPSLNGIGVQDALYKELFGMVGVASSTALGASILYHLSRLAVSLIGGVLYALGKDE